MGELGGDVGADGGMNRDDVVQDAQGVLAHFGASEKFGHGLGKVKAKLQSMGWDGDADVVVGEQETAVAVGDGSTADKEPSLGTG